MTDFEYRLSELQKIIDKSKNIVFLGGAGVSTASGIPDFRSATGLYNTVDPKYARYQSEYLLSRDCLEKEPEVFFEFFREKLDCRNIQPNITHLKLAEFERAGKNIQIITQNIDGLHQKAGSSKVYEVHGTVFKNHCDKCGKEYPADYIWESKEAVPHCECGGIIRPDVVLYGEYLPDEPFKASIHVLQTSETLIIAGTSLKVPPAAHLPQYFYGEKMIVINQQKTIADASADLVFREDMSEIFANLKAVKDR